MRAIINRSFLEFLKKNNGIFLVKKELLNQPYENVIELGYLSETDYKYLFENSNVIMLLYKQNFAYRTSGVLFECFANDVPVIMSDLPALRIYSEYFNYDPFYKTESTLIELMTYLLHHKIKPYRNIHNQDPKPYWENVIREMEVSQQKK